MPDPRHGERNDLAAFGVDEEAGGHDIKPVRFKSGDKRAEFRHHGFDLGDAKLRGRGQVPCVDVGGLSLHLSFGVNEAPGRRLPSPVLWTAISGDPLRAWMLAGAIWSAATGLGLSYAVPPASFEQSGQKIRDPGRVLAEAYRRDGRTCHDAACACAAARHRLGANRICGTVTNSERAHLAVKAMSRSSSCSRDR
nr:hypothetical protein [Paracoccus mutanolyticus]